MANGSVKVKKGQKIEAGTPLGKMGSTGISTGKHLHWELQKGKAWVWNSNGKNFIEPVAFFKAVIAKEAIVATAPVVTPEDAPVAPAPTHDDKGAAEIIKAEKVAPASSTAARSRKTVKNGSKGADVKHLQSKLGISADGDFGPKTHAAVVAFQTSKGLVADGIVGPKTWIAIG
jgi:hypothetical protein